jgi:hypothetical protein
MVYQCDLLDLSAHEQVSIHEIDYLTSFSMAAHRDESIHQRLGLLDILDDSHSFHTTVLREELKEMLLLTKVGEVADE